MNKIGLDVCRCAGKPDCHEREQCLRYTDRPEDGRYSFTLSLRQLDEELCPYKITDEAWNAS